MRTQSTDEKKKHYVQYQTHLFLGDTIHIQNTQSAPKKQRDALIDVRKEKCIGTGLLPILAPIPQMISPDEALPTCANIRIPIIIS